jgi:hypothetical protein
MESFVYFSVAVIFCIGVAGLYIFMKYRDKGYKDDNGEYIFKPQRFKD